MAATVLKVEADLETCSVCGGTGDLLTPEEYDACAPPLQVPLRTMLLHINNNKVIPEGRFCDSCIRRATEAYEFSSALGKTAPPLSEKIRALRKKLHELTQKIDVFIVVGGPEANVAGGGYSENDIIMVEKDALAAAAAADDEDMERARNACGDNVFQCSVCPLSFKKVTDFRAHVATHPVGAWHSCWTCSAQFASREALRDHARSHDAPEGLTCQLCRTTFQSSAMARRHEASCPARCPACGLELPGRGALAAHAAATHSDGPCVCPACFLMLPTRELLAAHALSHRRADRFVCGYDGCILRFPSRNDLLTHIRKVHGGSSPARYEAAPTPPPAPPTHPCDHCERTFGSAAALKRHARVHRRDLKQEEEPEWQVELEGADDGAEEADVTEVEMLEGDVEYLEMDALDQL